MNKLKHMDGSRTKGCLKQLTYDTSANNESAAFQTNGHNESEYAETVPMTESSRVILYSIANVQSNRAISIPIKLRLLRWVFAFVIMRAVVLLLLWLGWNQMQVKMEIKRLQQQLLQSNVNSSECKLDVDTYGSELLLALRSEFRRQWDETQTKINALAKLDLARLDALTDASDDNSRQKAFEMITPFKSDPQYTSDPEFLRRLATVQYFEAMNYRALYTIHEIIVYRVSCIDIRVFRYTKIHKDYCILICRYTKIHKEMDF